MSAIGDIAVYLFYGATLAAACFFIHKVFWLVQYKRLQRSIVEDAIRKLREGNEKDVGEWEEFARSCWSNALGQGEVSGPSTFIRRVEEGLAQIRGDLRKSRRSIEDLLGEALAGKGKRAEEEASPPSPSPDAPAIPEGAPATATLLASPAAPTPASPRVTRRVEVLSFRRVTKGGGDDRVAVSIDVMFPRVVKPRAPDKRLYELTVRSRYGLVRRALVFFSGVADVVYSSQHVALMSQNVHVPTSVLVRRLSLVFLVIAVVIVDFTFGVRTAITGVLNLWMHGPPLALGLHHATPAPRAVDGGVPLWVGTVLGFAAWAAIYGSIYLALYFAIRRRYQVNVRRLHELRDGEAEALRDIHRRNVAELSRWGRTYGKSLDAAVEITVRHAETLIDHHAHRLRRRIAGPALLDAAKTIADCLFLKLPESRGELQDVATAHEHSLRHHVWPRAEEMGYQVRFAQYRAAWQHMELAVGDLRKEQPDPNQAHALWRSAWAYASTFSHLVPAGMADELRQAYAQMVAECVAQTDTDLGDLDQKLVALHQSLTAQLASARPLVESRVELTSSHVHGAVASLSAEIIRVREQARLEAMAFEI